jgi:hypothetical protein
MICGLRRVGANKPAPGTRTETLIGIEPAVEAKALDRVEPVRRIHDQNLQKRYVD